MKKNITTQNILTNDQRMILSAIANSTFATTFKTSKEVKKMHELFRYILDTSDEALAHVELIKKLSK